MANGLHNAAKIISGKISNVPPGQLPKAAVSIAKNACVDTIAVMIAGAKEDCVNILHHLYTTTNTGTGVKVTGHPGKVDAKTAAFINATAAHALDLDDTGASSQGHPSAVLIPALLALSEKYSISGSRFITSYVYGVDVLYAVSQICPGLHERGIHPTSALGVIGAAAACSYLLGLNGKQMENALEMSASFSSGVVGNFGSMMKPMHAGMAASNGILCAEAAYNGYSASPGALGGDRGLLQLYSDYSSAEIKRLLEAIGTKMALIDPGLHIKRYPSCALSHRMLDVLFDLKKKAKLIPEDVVSVKCRATPLAKQVLHFGIPDEPMQGKFSMPFLMAAALLYDEISPGLFNDETMNHAETRRLMERVDFREHEDWDETGDKWRPDIVEIRLRNGTSLKGSSVYPKGHAKNPFKQEELKTKFLDCINKDYSPDDRERLYRAILKLEAMKNVAELMTYIK